MNRTSDHLTHRTQPAALALVEALAAGPEDAEHLGIRPTRHGVIVDWDRLANAGRLSPQEAAVAIIAHGVAILESGGAGVPGHLTRPLRDAIGRTAR